LQLPVPHELGTLPKPLKKTVFYSIQNRYSFAYLADIQPTLYLIEQDKLIMVVTSSNDYAWNADDVLNQLIEDRGQSLVVFMNGLWTPLGSEPDEGFQKQWRAVEQTFGLIDYGATNQTSVTLPGYKSSFQFEPIYNPSKGNDLDEKPKWFFTFTNALSEYLFKPAVQNYEQLGLDLEDDTYKRVKELAYDPFQRVTNIPKVFTQGSDVRDEIGSFVQQYGNLNQLEINISGDYPYDPNSDLLEAFAQFFSDSPALVSQKINSNPLELDGWQQEAWVPKSISWLQQNPNNSLILVGHSQGNFFLEDGLMNSGFESVDGSHVRVVALGSPTDYSALTQDSSLTGEVVANFKNEGDPITDLQFPVGTSEADKISIALEALNWKNLGGLIVGGKHDLEGSNNAYLNQSAVKDKFKEFAYELNPKGYYFPDGPQSTQGTEDGDYLEGSEGKNDTIRGYERNDVLRGNTGDDTLIGDEGYDFLDGGLDVDTADYSQDPGKIVVRHNTIAGSDVYSVQDGYGQEDVLVDIEQIFGSNYGGTVGEAIAINQYCDEMYGGEGNDYFYGLGGQDKLIGNRGNDYLDGGDGGDVLRGGAGSDTIYANVGNDIIFGGGGDDILYGGTGNSTLSGGRGSDLFALTAGEGVSTIINFDINVDLLGLTDGLTFEQLAIAQGTSGDEFFTQLSVASSGDLLATLSGVQADSITGSAFSVIS
jgi:Ca2+-binding RTX toxin-like protein